MPNNFNQLIESLNKKELKEFKKNVAKKLSPDHVKVMDIFLAKNGESYSDKDLANLYAKAQKLPFSERIHTAFRKKKLNLLNLLESFLIEQQLHQSPPLRQYLLANVYNERGLIKLFDKQKEKVLHPKEQDEKDAYLGFPKRWLDYQITNISYYSVANANAKYDAEKLMSTILKFQREFLLRWFFLKVEMLIHSKTFSSLGEKEKNQVIYIPIQEIEQQKHDWPLWSWLQKIYKAYVNVTNECDFEELFEEFKIHQNELETHEKQMTLKLILNIANRSINLNPRFYAKKILPIYKYSFQQKLLPYNGFIEGPIFINIVILALLSEDYRWYQSFISSYSKFLFNKDKTNVLLYCDAYYNYKVGLKDKNPDLLSKASLKLKQMSIFNPAFGIRVRSLEARIHYELDLEDFNHALKLMLRNLKERPVLSPILIKKYQKFAHLGLKLGELKSNQNQIVKSKKNERDFSTFETELEKSKDIFLYSWLKEKLEELKLS